MESASWQRPLYGFKINQEQAGIPLKMGVLGQSGGVILQPPTARPKDARKARTLPPSVRQRSDMGQYVSAVGGMGKIVIILK